MRPSAAQVAARLGRLVGSTCAKGGDPAGVQASDLAVKPDAGKAEDVRAQEGAASTPPPPLRVVEAQENPRSKLGHSLRGPGFASTLARRGGQMREKTLAGAGVAAPFGDATIPEE